MTGRGDREAVGPSAEDRLEHYAGEDAAVRALLALDAGGMASWRLDIETSMVSGDDRLATLYGFEPGHFPIPLGALEACIHPGDVAGVQARIARCLRTGTEYATEFRVRRTPGADPDDAGSWRWLGGRGRVVSRGEDGAANALMGVNWDVTDRKDAEGRAMMMATEMDHRVKNAFAVMRALVNIGRRGATDVESFADDLSAQVQAMADGHEVAARLAREGADPRPAIPVSEVVGVVLKPLLAAEPDRVTASLNPRLCVSSAKVSGLTMLLHELLTNAAKHGALRPDAGRLNVTVEETRRAGLLMARLTWNEAAEAPLPAPQPGAAPTSGFGSILIEHCMSVLGASYERSLRPEGLKMTVVLPVSDG